MPPAGIAVALGVNLFVATVISNVLIGIAITAITPVLGPLVRGGVD